MHNKCQIIHQIFISCVKLLIKQGQRGTVVVSIFTMAYFDSLDAPSQKRKTETISLIGGIEPYTIHNSLFETNLEQFPSITAYDIVYYLIYNSSPFPHDQIKHFCL